MEKRRDIYLNYLTTKVKNNESTKQLKRDVEQQKDNTKPTKQP